MPETSIVTAPGPAEKIASFTSTLALGQRPARGRAATESEGKDRKLRVAVTGGSGKLGRAVVRDVSVQSFLLGDGDRLMEREILLGLSVGCARMGRYQFRPRSVPRSRVWGVLRSQC